MHWLKNGWSTWSRPAGAVYASCILAALATYAYSNRIGPVTLSVGLLILALVSAACAILAGQSGDTWADPSNALGVLLIACALILDGFFIAGASTFGPTRVLDVGVVLQSNPYNSYLWNDGHWMQAKFSEGMSWDDLHQIEVWAENLKLNNDLDAKPGVVQISTWDRQVHRITMKNLSPPITIAEAPRTSMRAFMELTLGLMLLIVSLLIWREGRRRGIRYHQYDPFTILAERSRN